MYTPSVGFFFFFFIVGGGGGKLRLLFADQTFCDGARKKSNRRVLSPRFFFPFPLFISSAPLSGKTVFRGVPRIYRRTGPPQSLQHRTRQRSAPRTLAQNRWSTDKTTGIYIHVDMYAKHKNLVGFIGRKKHQAPVVQRPLQYIINRIELYFFGIETNVLFVCLFDSH